MKEKELMLLQLLAKAESYPKWWGGSGFFENRGNWVKRLIHDLELLPEQTAAEKKAKKKKKEKKTEAKTNPVEPEKKRHDVKK